MRWLLLFFTCLILSCGPDHETLAGRYTAQREGNSAVELQLEGNGEGAWTVEGGASMAFTWSQERNRVVLRTKTGGLVAGERQGDAIILQLPGVERLTFLPARQ